MPSNTSARNVNELSFMQDGKWSPERSGCYNNDCERGRSYAQEMLDAIETNENPAMFGSIVRAVTVGGVFAGVEAGFCSRIGITLVGLR